MSHMRLPYSLPQGKNSFVLQYFFICATVYNFLVVDYVASWKYFIFFIDNISMLIMKRSLIRCIKMVSREWLNWKCCVFYYQAKAQATGIDKAERVSCHIVLPGNIRLICNSDSRQFMSSSSLQHARLNCKQRCNLKEISIPVNDSTFPYTMRRIFSFHFRQDVHVSCCVVCDAIGLPV